MPLQSFAHPISKAPEWATHFPCDPRGASTHELWRGPLPAYLRCPPDKPEASDATSHLMG